MAEYIEREDLIRRLELSIKSWSRDCNSNAPVMVRTYEDVLHKVKNLPAANVVEVVRCKDCKHCKELAPHCEINRYAYFHCNLWRGEETKNVWHKYKKYTADYSIVEPTDFCSYGERKEREGK